MYLLVLRHSLEILRERLCGFTYDNGLNVCLDTTSCVEDTLLSNYDMSCRRSRVYDIYVSFSAALLSISICRTQDPPHSLLTGKVFKFDIQSECVRR